MSTLAMTDTEKSAINAKVEEMMPWARANTVRAEQLAFDAVRLLACTEERLAALNGQGFFKRCWTRFNGSAGAMERANTNALIQMQRMALVFVNQLQQQQILTAHSMISLKNNLACLAAKEGKTLEIIAHLATRTFERFEELESRIERVEVQTALQSWLITLEEREYRERIPENFMRFFQVVNDYYSMKNDDWNPLDYLYMRKALRLVGIDPNAKISLRDFINQLVDEVKSVGNARYTQAISMFSPFRQEETERYSKYVVDNISSAIEVALHGVSWRYLGRSGDVETVIRSLQKREGGEFSEEKKENEKFALLKDLLVNDIENLSINIEYEFSYAEAACELLECMKLAEKLHQIETAEENAVEHSSFSGIEASEQQVEQNRSASEEKASGPETDQYIHCPHCFAYMRVDEEICLNCGMELHIKEINSEDTLHRSENTMRDTQSLNNKSDEKSSEQQEKKKDTETSSVGFDNFYKTFEERIENIEYRLMDGYVPITAEEIDERAKKLIKSRASFIVVNAKATNTIAAKIESMIENNGLRVRVYTKHRAVGAFVPPVAVGIGLHNLLTLNPDYEVAKDFINDQVEVTYKK